MYVLDTNTLIYFFKGVGNVSEKLLEIAPKEIGIPSIVIYELEVGIAKSTSPEKRTEQLAEVLSLVNILPFGLKEARSASGIRVESEKRGHLIGRYDILIAATALVNQATFITHNTKEFGRIDQLQCEDWIS
jgi:tRNA(fMet)-specific endonuclease VapC